MSLDSSSAYEFTDAQNERLTRFVAASLVGMWLGIMLLKVADHWLRQIAARFNLIVETEGSDMGHLDNALEITRRLFLSASYLVAGFTLGLMSVVAKSFATIIL